VKHPWLISAERRRPARRFDWNAVYLLAGAGAAVLVYFTMRSLP